MNRILKDIRYRIEYAGFRFVAFLFGALPLETASAFSGCIWARLAPWTGRHPRALEQLRLAMPNLSLAEREAIARNMWNTMGRTFAEFFHLDEIAASGRVTLDDSAGALAQAAAAGGFVVGAAHQGNWEIAVLSLRSVPKQVSGPYQRIKNPYVDRYVRDQRAPHYSGALFEKQNASGLKLVRHLRQGQIVTILADQRDNHGALVPFFGRNAPSTPFPALLARNVGVPLLAGLVERLPNVRFRVRIAHIDVPQTQDKAADILQATANLHAALEASIREHPEQWMWAHRRWG